MSTAEPAALFAALGDATRLALLRRLSGEGAQSIAALAAGTRLTRQAVTKHLDVLERAGFVARARVGRESRYAFCPKPVNAAQDELAAVAAQWEAALERLRAFVEE